MPTLNSINQSYLLLNENSSYLLEVHNDGLSLSSASNHRLFEIKEPVLLAQGTIDDAQQIHLAYIKNSGELCYSVILPTGNYHTMPLGKLDIRTQRFDRLFLFPAGKVIHLFYASSHYSLPDVWRITHLFWNGQTWKSAQLGEVVHPRYPLFQVLKDSRSNLHVLMMTFLGSRSVLLSSMFNGTFYLWSKRQEVLNIPREVVDMTAIITPQDEGHLFWAAKQPASDRYEIGHGVQGKMNDFKSSWRIDAPPASNLEGPWNGLGAIQSQGIINLLVNINQVVIFQPQGQSWKPVMAVKGDFSPLQIARKFEGTTTYTHWLRQEDQTEALFADELTLVYKKAPPIEVAPFKDYVSNDTSRNTNTSEVPPPMSPIMPPEMPLGVNDGAEPLARNENLTPQPARTEANSQSSSHEDSSVQTPSHEPSDDTSDRHLTLIFSDIKETTTSITSNLEHLSEKVDSLPEVLELLKELKIKNEQTLDTLQQLETKVNQYQTQKEVATRKGFWQRWLT